LIRVHPRQDRANSVAQQAPIAVYYRGHLVGDFRCDLLLENKVILELKAVREIAQEHIAQTLNYLKATDVEVALLLNFGEKPAFKRLVFDNERKMRRGAERQAATD
jgi:GxxExxY protein